MSPSSAQGGPPPAQSPAAEGPKGQMSSEEPLAAINRISVKGTEEMHDANGNTFTAYVIEVSTGRACWLVKKRYRELLSFAQQVKKDAGAGLTFPGKMTAGEKRRNMISMFLIKLVGRIEEEPERFVHSRHVVHTMLQVQQAHSMAKKAAAAQGSNDAGAGGAAGDIL